MERQLNPRQAKWALLFPCFNFMVSYRPGSQNIKADALPHTFRESEEEPKEETIIAKTKVIGAIQWKFDDEIHHAVLPECPSEKKVRIKLITWAYTLPATGHPGMHRTWELIKDEYRWPSMLTDINKYVSSCTRCAQAKVPCLYLLESFCLCPSPLDHCLTLLSTLLQTYPYQEA